MKILSETTHIVSHVIVIAVCIGIALFLLVGAVAWFVSMVRYGAEELGEVIGLIVVTALGLFIAFACFAAIKQGADTTYKATITDFNVVYEQGYTIIEQDGLIYTLEKKTN